MRRLLVLVCLLLAWPVIAQDGDFQPGEPVTGVINDETPRVTRTFRGEAGRTIYITLVTQEFAGELRLLGPEGTSLAQVEENILNTSLIGPLRLPSDGEYTIVATRPEWEDAGGEFMLVGGPVETIMLQPGEPVEGHLDHPGAAVFFAFEGEADDVVHYFTEGEGLGIAIRTPTGDELVSDGHYNSPGRLLNLLPESGRYRGVVQTVAPEGTPFILGVEPIQTQPLQSGEPVSGTLQEHRWPVFTFESAAGKLWQLSASGDTDEGQFFLEIHRPDAPDYYGSPLAQDCCRGPGGTPRIDPFTAPEDGTYYVVLGYDDYVPETNTEVAYELALASSTLVSLAPGNAVTGSVTPDSGIVTYAYEGTAGEAITVTIQRTGGAGNPGLRILSAEDEVMVFEGRNARVASFEVELPHDGLYLFEISNITYEPNTLDFSLRLDVP